MKTLQVENLRIDGMRRPQYVRESFQFSWNLAAIERKFEIKSYQIQIYCNECLIWDSGSVESACCRGIPYIGPQLAPLETHEWVVICRDTLGNTAQAKDFFRTCRGDAPWTTSWVQPAQQPTVEERPFPFGAKRIPQPRDYKEFQPTQLVRRSVLLKKKIQKAVLHISAHGVYRLECNGAPVATPILAPGCTPYDKLIYFQSYDLTEELVLGKNVIGIELADGWWVSRLGVSSWNCQYGDKKDLFFSLDVTYADQSCVSFGGEEAKAMAGSTQYADLCVGECHNAALQPLGWSTPNFDDSTWSTVEPLPYPLDTLQPQQGEPLEVFKRWEPKQIFKDLNGDWVIDAGQVMAGFMQFTVDSEANRKIVLEYSEILDENGCFFQNIMGANKDQRDVYITRAGKQTWQPSFTYHGFRYVRITGWEGTPLKNQFVICSISSQPEISGDFSCSDARLNQLFHNILWSQISNSVEIPTDCPQREKAGWTGDIAVYAPTMLYLSPAENFLRRWLQYVRLEQFENGLVPCVVPYWKGFQATSAVLGSDTSCGWGDCIIFVPWALYEETGDSAILRENYAAMKQWMTYMQSEAETGKPEGYEFFSKARQRRQKYLWNTGFHYGDWLMPSIIMSGGVPRDTANATKKVFACAYYAHSASLMEKISLALGENADSETFGKLYRKIRSAFIEEFIQPNGAILPEFQGAYVIALKFALVPKKLCKAAVARLCDMIEANGNCLDTGFLSVHLLLDALCEHGRKDMAYRLLYQTNCPSWLYMVNHGATTIWESWNCISPDGKIGECSYNHYALGSVGSWMFREIAGLHCIESGYRRVQIVPGIESGLAWAATSHLTPYGTISVHWKQDSERITVETQIPGGIEADLCISNRKPIPLFSGKSAYSFTMPTAQAPT